MVETWLPVPGWEDLYEVSDLGQVRSLSRMVKTRGGGQRISPGKVLTPGTYDDGHKHVTFTTPGIRRTYQVHKLVLLAFVGPCPEGLQVRHLNGIPDDNRLENLTYGTPAENMADRDHVHQTNYQSNKTHCGVCGNPYDEENTYWYKGSRQCQNCRRTYRQRRQEKA